MSVHKNLILIGTSHIAKDSVKEIKKTIIEEKPEIIALELDLLRFRGLTKKTKRKIRIKDIKKIGFIGFFFNMIGALAEKKMGKLAGMDPGSEMLYAIKIAKKKNIKLVLIDRDIRITLKRLSNKLTFKEKINFIIDIIGTLLFRKKIDNNELKKVPNQETINQLIRKFRKRYPNLYKILVVERDIIMAKNLNSIVNKNPKKKIMAVIGAGHKENMSKILQI